MTSAWQGHATTQQKFDSCCEGCKISEFRVYQIFSGRALGCSSPYIPVIPWHGYMVCRSVPKSTTVPVLPILEYPWVFPYLCLTLLTQGWCWFIIPKWKVIGPLIISMKPVGKLDKSWAKHLVESLDKNPQNTVWASVNVWTNRMWVNVCCADGMAMPF